MNSRRFTIDGTNPLVWDETLANSAEAYSIQLKDLNAVSPLTPSGQPAELLYRVESADEVDCENALADW